MKLYSAAQIREWDAYTIEHEPIASLDLMNRAAEAFTRWFTRHYPDPQRPVLVFCGTGNNGGDGVAVSRLLHWLGYDAKVVVCDFAGKRSADFEAQIDLLPAYQNIAVEWMRGAFHAVPVPENAVLIDALFGSGLNRVLDGEWAKVIGFINALSNEVVAIDLPSGLFADHHTPGNIVICARRTFSFERPKKAFFFPENEVFTGDCDYGSIGLHPDFELYCSTDSLFLTLEEAKQLRRVRAKFSHKGSFGHALLLAGSFGKMGAAVLAARACLRAGTGLLTVHAPRGGNLILQTTVPEAMSSADKRAKYLSQLPDIVPYKAIGIGPGIGKEPETAEVLHQLIQEARVPLVLDADALNLLSMHPEWWPEIPPGTIITPHPGEFERLFGKCPDDFAKNALQREMAQKHGIIIVLKGANTSIALPDGACWFNTTGNPGMATGGSGDVLTGILTGLLAQGYTSEDAALLGVFLHGLSGDLAAQAKGQEGLTAGDLADFLGNAWLHLER